MWKLNLTMVVTMLMASALQAQAGGKTLLYAGNGHKNPMSPKLLEKLPKHLRRAAYNTARVGWESGWGRKKRNYGGTGFVLGEFNGHILLATNFHVMDGKSCGSAKIYFQMLEKTVGCDKVITSLESPDIAIVALKVKKPEDRALLLKNARNFAFRSKHEFAQPLITFGHGVYGNPDRKLMVDDSTRLKNSLRSCQILNEDVHDPLRIPPINKVHTTCTASPGDSGSPLVDYKTGAVTGIIRSIDGAKTVGGKRVVDWTEATPASEIKRLFEMRIEELSLMGKADSDEYRTLKALITPKKIRVNTYKWDFKGSGTSSDGKRPN